MLRRARSCGGRAACRNRCRPSARARSGGRDSATTSAPSVDAAASSGYRKRRSQVREQTRATCESRAAPAPDAAREAACRTSDRRRRRAARASADCASASVAGGSGCFAGVVCRAADGRRFGLDRQALALQHRPARGPPRRRSPGRCRRRAGRDLHARVREAWSLLTRATAGPRGASPRTRGSRRRAAA